MQKKRILSLLLAVSCSVSLLTGCGGKTGPETNGGDGEHEAITMTAMVPFRNPSHLADLVHEKYPEINIEFIPYSGYNATAYAAMELAADEMTDIYFGSMYAPAVTDVSDHLLDMSAYPFTDNFTDQRLREVTDDGHIYMLPLYYSVLGITYNKTKRQRIRHAYGYAVAAALLAGVLVTALYLSRPAGITEEAAVRQTAVVLPDGTGDTAVPDTDAGSEPPQTVSGANTPQPVRAVAKTDGEDTVPERQTAAAGQENAPAGKDTEARDAPPAVREGDRNGQRGRSRKRPAYPSPGSAAAELRRNTDAYWERAIAREYGGAPRRKVAGSVYAGNFGTFAGNSVTNDPDRAASAGMLIKQTSDGGMTLQSGLHEENGRPVLAPTGPVTEEVRLQHRMPLNVGLSLSVPLGERLALTTGLNYSYLYSSSEQSFSAGTAHITRELHYIGVPVGLTYTFYRAGGFGFYVQGGGMVEKGVAWRETQGFADAGDSGRESTLRRIKGVQFSVSAAAGVSYNFNRHIGLYVEPGVGYYFRQKDQPASYRTVHPTSFSVKVGVRFGL